MDDFNSKTRDSKDQEIIYSRSIKAGKRIYYLDVKRNRKGEMYLAITESKKIISGYDENAQVSYEKHKIFLYREDFEKFEDGISDVMGFIRREDPVTENHYEYKSERVGNEYKNDYGDATADQTVTDGSVAEDQQETLSEFKMEEFE
ncbi:MAG: PUR family DNA/RNA-binding protein [Paludibacteraceae bacterium]|jgi:hypothetical protein|nr:PUR family DNA/RNA-binding protein [Paludibacteraceae bacterium]MCR5298660.1 PUR family DNA/RNA-binding protein [Paludibacteraceae bacterium]